jgi:hypothetical protein
MHLSHPAQHNSYLAMDTTHHIVIREEHPITNRIPRVHTGTTLQERVGDVDEGFHGPFLAEIAESSNVDMDTAGCCGFVG